MDFRVLPLIVAACGCAAAFAAASATPSPPVAHQEAKVEFDGYDHFIVKYKAASSQRTDSRALQRHLQQVGSRRKKNGRALALGRLRRMALGADLIVSDRKLDRAEADSLMKQIAADPNVEYAEVDGVMYPAMTPNDPHAKAQWHFSGPYGARVDQAWDVSTGAGVVVAVVDTGITDHPDLSQNVLPGYDFISDATKARDGNGRDNNPRDEGSACGDGSSSWHGTHVAGIVAAVTNNAIGVAGVAPNAKIVPVRVLGRCGGATSDIADAIVWAAGGDVSGVPSNPYPADVINLSLGGWKPVLTPLECAATLQASIDAAVALGSVVVAAAGNSGEDVIEYEPASCRNVITVAATDQTGQRSEWSDVSSSNYGTEVDVAAPGSNVYSTCNQGLQTPSTDTWYCYMGGTSMAAPHVSGVVALMQAAAERPLRQYDAEQIIRSTARPFPVSPTVPIGAGLLDSRAAVDSAKTYWATAARRASIIPLLYLTLDPP